MLWKTADPNVVVPAVHSTATGGGVAVCKPAELDQVQSWQWVPDTVRGVAAWGECLINFTSNTTVRRPGFQPLSITGTTVYGTVSSNMVAVTPGAVRTLAPGTARPWGLAGSHAIVVQDSVVYALDKL